jgi:hypothetical protein
MFNPENSGAGSFRPCLFFDHVGRLHARLQPLVIEGLGQALFFLTSKPGFGTSQILKAYEHRALNR